MKTLSVFLLTLALWCGALPPRAVQAQDTITFEVFYDSLEPHGEWIEVGEFGYCWRPFVASDDAMWRPYSDGHWMYTDGGWTWASNEDFGWAVYHYGRWARVIGLGWVWVPGYEWAPAWVSWRDTPDKEYVGWAPLPPEASFEISIGFNTWVDDYYDIGPSCYNFVRYQDFGEPRLRTVMVPYEQNVVIIRNTVNITNISYRDTVVNNVFIGGPQYDFVKSRSHREVRQLKLRRRDDFDWGRMRQDSKGYGKGINHREGDSFLVAAPSIRRFRDDERRGPQNVKRQVKDVTFDRGWSGVKEATVADQIRQRMRQDADRTRPQVMPEKRGPLGSRDRDGRVGAVGDSSRDRGEGNNRDRKDGPGEGRKDMIPGPGTEGRTTPGTRSQADIARRLEEEKKIRERGTQAMQENERERPGRPGGAPPTGMRDARDREAGTTAEVEQRRRAAEAAKEMEDRRMREDRTKQENDRRTGMQATQEKARAEAEEGKRRMEAERISKERMSKAQEQQREMKDRESKAREEQGAMKERAGKEREAKDRAEGERRRAMESQGREQKEAQDRARTMERQKQEQPRPDMEKARRQQQEGAQKQQMDNARKQQAQQQQEMSRRNAEQGQREAAERARRAADESRRQQPQARRPEEARPRPEPQARPQPQPQQRPQPQARPDAGPGGREAQGDRGGKPRGKDKDKDDDKKGR
jgi:hypothetical protein